MPSDRTPAATEPAPGADAESAGSVVVGVDPSNPDGTAAVHIAADAELLGARLNETALVFQRFRESLTRTAPAVQRAAQALAGVRVPEPMPPYDAGDAMC